MAGRLKAETLADIIRAHKAARMTDNRAKLDSLEQALDREQALHMASLQARLPAGRGFFSWLKGKKGDA